jgi:hypothetical protein
LVGMGIDDFIDCTVHLALPVFQGQLIYTFDLLSIYFHVVSRFAGEDSAAVNATTPPRVQRISGLAMSESKQPLYKKKN